MHKAMLSVVMGLAIVGCAEEGAPFERSGSVRRASGTSPVREGAACTVGIANESRGGYPCRVSVTCEGHTLYGGPALGGYAECSAANGRWLRASDDMLAAEDGDPWMDFDVRAGTIVIRTAEAETVIDVAAPRDRTAVAAR